MAAPFATTHPIQLRLLGDVALTGAPGGDALLRKPMRLAFLAYLALKPAGFYRRDTICTVFWPEIDQSSARNSLRHALSEVRRDVGGKKSADGERVLPGRGKEEVALNREVVWCDVDVLEHAIDHHQYLYALELYRGPLMHGFHSGAPGFDDFLDGERERLRRNVSKAASELAKECERNQQLTNAVNFARRAVELSYLEEKPVLQVARLLKASGERIGALRVLDEFAKTIRREFNAEPSAEMKALREDLRQG